MLRTILLCLPFVAALPQDWNRPSNSFWSGYGGSDHERPGYGAPGHEGRHSTAYFLENDPSGNNIVALRIGTDGQLSDPVRTSTGGRGAFSVNGTGAPDQRDTLGSQGSVVVSQDMLFTVNAGDNTVSMFMLDAQQPQHPRLIGSPVTTLGEFPISVTYSERLRQVCVLNGGAVAGVSCLSVDPYHGLQAAGPLRTLSSSIIDETTPPNGPPGAASEILFNPSSDALFATIRGVPGTRLGSILAWPVKDGQVSEDAPVISQMDDIKIDFAFLFTEEKEMFLVDPSFGVSLLQVGPDLKLTEMVHTPVPGQGAICWANYDRELDTLYAIDAGTNSIYLIDPKSGQLKGDIAVNLPDSAMGLFDASIQEGILYALAASNGIVAIDLAQKQQIQYLDLSNFSDRQFYQGFATW